MRVQNPASNKPAIAESLPEVVRYLQIWQGGRQSAAIRQDHKPIADAGDRTWHRPEGAQWQPVCPLYLIWQCKRCQTGPHQLSEITALARNASDPRLCPAPRRHMQPELLPTLRPVGGGLKVLPAEQLPPQPLRLAGGCLRL